MIIQSSGLLYLLHRIITSETRVIILRSNRSVQGPQSSSNTVTSANGTIQQKKMEPSVSGTDQPEDQNVLRRTTLTPTKCSLDLNMTTLQPIKYTPAQVHERVTKNDIKEMQLIQNSIQFTLYPNTLKT